MLHFKKIFMTIFLVLVINAFIIRPVWSIDRIIFVDTATNESLSFDPDKDEYVVKYLSEDGGTLLETRFELPNKAKARLNVNVEKGINIFKYRYGLVVDSKSPRAVMDLALVFDSSVIESLGSPTTPQFMPNLFLQNYSIPENWTFSRYIRRDRPRICWSWSPMHHFPPPIFESTPPTEYGVKPGAEQQGFGFDDVTGNFIPGIIDAIFYSVQLVEDGYESEEPASIAQITFRDFHRLDHGVFVRTIGPKKASGNLSDICDTFILDLIGQMREAVALGWIKHDLRKDHDDDDNHGLPVRQAGKGKGDEKGKKKGHDKDDDEGDDNGGDDDLGDADKNLPGVAKSIIKKLAKVRRECLRGKFGSAREKLRALIKQVNAQRGKHLTEEAYALIKFNAEFLLEKL